jgi:hypothetical protein
MDVIFARSISQHFGVCYHRRCIDPDSNADPVKRTSGGDAQS